MSCSCNCGGNCTTLFYACSGAANTGYLSDNVARTLAKDGLGKMSCLAALGADLSGFIESAKSAKNIVLDGCSVACGKKIFDEKGLSYTHIVMTDLGVEKGKTEISPDIVAKIASEVSRKINAEVS